MREHSERQLREKPKLREWMSLLGWLVLAVVVLVDTSSLRMTSGSFGIGPRFLSFYLSCIMLFFCLVRAATLGWQWRAWWIEQGKPKILSDLCVVEDLPKRALARFFALIGSIFFFALILDPLGFVIAASFLCWSILSILGRPKSRAAIESVIAAAFLYLAFSKFLGVQLPYSNFEFLNAIGL